MARPLSTAASSASDPPLDVDQLEQGLRRIVVDRLRIYGGFAAAWGALQLFLFQILHAALGPLLYLVGAGFTIAAAAAFVAARRLAWSSSQITAVGVGIGLFQLLLHALTVAQTGEETYFYMAVCAVLGSGVLVAHPGWLALYLVAGSAELLVLDRPHGHSLAGDVLVLAAASTASVVLHLVGRRYVLDIERLRQSDHAHRRALEAALETARQQLRDRERAEAERAQLLDQLIHAQKMESLGTLAGGFAHDMNNVLGAILAGAELLREDAPEPLHGDIDDVITSAQRGAELTRNLLGFARRGQYRKEHVDLRAAITDMIRMLQRTVPKGVVFESSFADPCTTVEGDPALLTQALINLCLNAVDAMRGVGRLAIEVGAVDLPLEGMSATDLVPGRYASIAVRDTGSGMDADVRRRIFEPFFTTKQVGRGTGLGLAMVYGTVKSWGGEIKVDSVVGTGTTMTMYLPLVEPRASAVEQRVTAGHATVGGTILVVDDDPQLRKLARRVLEGRGYQVHEAGDGAEAITVFEKHGGDYQLVLLDMAMPVMAGAECFRELRRRSPDLPVLLASGYALEEDARRCLSEGALGFVDKPYTIDALSAAIKRAVRGEVVGVPTQS